jgi:hypothetical protein
MANCYWCGCELNEQTNSIEHIIKQSFGGTITSNKILCKTHNNYFGITIDARISNEMDYMYDSLILDLKSKKRITLYNSTGEEFQFGTGLRPLPYLKFEVDGKKVKEYFDTEEEMQKRASVLQQQLEGRKETWDLNFIELPKTASIYYFNKDKQAKFGSDDYHLSFIKIAVGYFLDKNGEQKYIDHAIDVLKGNVIDNRLTRFYYSNLYKPELKNDEVNHFIYLKGDKEKRILYCYIELFSTHKMLLFLNSEYDGIDIEGQYCIDLISKKKITKDFKMNLLREHYEDLPKISIDTEAEHGRAYNRLLKIIEKNALKRHQEENKT